MKPSDVAASASPAASGYSVLSSLPPHPWACALTGSFGPKNNHIVFSPLVFALLGTSPDIPIAWCTQIPSPPTIFGEIIPRHISLPRATWLPQRTPRTAGVHSRQTIETDCCARTLRTTQWWHPRSWRKLADAPGSKPGAQHGHAGSNPAERTNINCHAPLGKLEKPPDSGSGALGVRLPRGAPRVASSKA